MILRRFALQQLPPSRGLGRALRCAIALAAAIPGAAMAQTQPAPASAAPLLPPTRQYPLSGIQSEPLAPPPGAASPSTQTPSVTTPASPQPPNVITPALPPAVGAVPESAASPATQGQPETGATPGAPQTAPAQPPAAEAAAPPLPNPWVPQGGAVVQVLDKPDAESRVLTIKAGQSATYRSLTITVKACDVRPPDMPPDSTAFLDITDSHPGQPGFSGWMLASDPSLNMMQNPIYNVHVKGCTP